MVRLFFLLLFERCRIILEVYRKRSLKHIFRCNLFLSALLIFVQAGPGLCEIIFADNFESGVLSQRWDDINFSELARGGYETDPRYVHSGSRALRLTAVANNGNASGSQLICWFMPGYDKLFFRWYAMFAEDFDQGNLMHWTGISGNRIDNKWSGFGKAGIRPSGTDFFSTGVEPWRNWEKHPAPGEMTFYSYFPEMEVSSDGVHYWGNQFKPDTPFVIQRGRWYCFEVMVKLNTPGKHDGEQALLVDGEKIIHVTGMRWRDSEMLKLNAFALSVYIHQATRDNTCYYDDLIISTEYVEPMADPPMER